MRYRPYLCVGIVIVVFLVAGLGTLVVVKHKKQSEEALSSSIGMAYVDVMSEQPVKPEEFRDAVRFERLKSKIDRLRTTVRQNPREAVKFLSSQNHYVDCMTEEVIKSGDMQAIGHVVELALSGEVSAQTRKQIICGMVPEDFTGEAVTLVVSTLKKIVLDATTPSELRFSALGSLIGSRARPVAQDPESQALVLNMWTSLGSTPEQTAWRLDIFYAICASVPWQQARPIVMGSAEEGAKRTPEEIAKWVWGLEARLRNIGVLSGSVTAQALAPATEDVRLLISEVSRLMDEYVGNDALRVQLGDVLGELVAYAPDDLARETLGGLLKPERDEAIRSMIFSESLPVPVNNSIAHSLVVLEHALSRTQDTNLSQSDRALWLGALNLLIQKNIFSTGWTREARSGVAEKLRILQQVSGFDQRHKEVIGHMITMCETDWDKSAAWDRVGQAGERLGNLVEEGSTSVDDYSRIALDALLDVKVDTYTQAMAKVMELGPKTQIALRLKASTGMYVNLNIQKYKANLDELVGVYPDFANGYGQRAYCYLKSGEYEKASADVNKAADLGPNSSVTYLAWGMMLMHQHDFVAATEKLKKAMSLTSELKEPDVMPEDFVSANLATETWLGLGVSLFAQSKWNEAGEQFAKCLAKFPMNDDVLLWAYVSALLSGDAAAPKDLFTRWVKDVRGYKLSTGAQNKFIGFLVEGADDVTILKHLADNKSSVSWSGDGVFVAGKWLQNKAQNELAKAYFTKAARMAKDSFFASALASYELTKMTEGK